MRCFNPLIQIESGDSTPSTGKTVEDGVTLPLNNNNMVDKRTMKKLIVACAIKGIPFDVISDLYNICSEDTFKNLAADIVKAARNSLRTIKDDPLSKHHMVPRPRRMRFNGRIHTVKVWTSRLSWRRVYRVLD